MLSRSYTLCHTVLPQRKCVLFCVLMTQELWDKEVVSLIAEAVRHYRTERKMSAERLSQACKDAGYKIPRSVIANLESGRRDTVSIPEWLVLARALQVPPMLLLFPLGRAEQMEVLPGRSMTPWAALAWAEEGQTDDGYRDVVSLYRQHAELTDQWDQVTEQLRLTRAELDGTADWTYVTGFSDDGDPVGEPPDRERARLRLPSLERQQKLIEDRLKIRRMRMRQHDLEPPVLPERFRFLGDQLSL
jgi:Helix-turn-helix domain